MAHDDGMPLSCLVVDRHLRVAVDDFVAACPATGLTLADLAYDIDDEEYAELVGRSSATRSARARAPTSSSAGTTRPGARLGRRQGLTVFRRLLESESGAYWTFCFFTATAPGRRQPERHVTSHGGTVTMNPISGTFRLPPDGVPPDDLRASSRPSSRDEKEIYELFMVVDEELKMMCDVCHEGGQVLGPFLKPMSHLVHTEYLLAGHTSADPRELLRDTMYAATVTGSPVENACRLIKQYETEGRGYYGARSPSSAATATAAPRRSTARS